MKPLITSRNHYYDPASHIIFLSRLNGNPAIPQIKNAISRSVSSHEIFSTRLLQDDQGRSFYASCNDKTVKIEKIKIDDNRIEAFINEQKKIPFDFIRGELLRFYINETTEHIDLIVIAHHLAGDGLALTYLISDIVFLMNNPSVNRDLRPLQLIDEIGFPGNTEISLIEKGIRKFLNNKWRREKRIFQYREYLEMFHSYWETRHIQLKRAEITGVELQDLIRRCKNKNISINSALCAAFKYILKEGVFGMPVSIRPENYTGMGNYASGISIDYRWNKKENFWENTERIQKLIHRKLFKDKRKYHVLQFLKGLEPTLIDATYFEMYSDYSSDLVKKTVKLFNYTNDKKHIFGITNLTKPPIQTQYQHYSIDSMLFMPPIIATTDIVMGIITIDDKMSITMQYPESEKSTHYGNAFEEAVQILKNPDIY